MFQTPKLHLTFIKQNFHSEDSLYPEAKTLYIPKQNCECWLIVWGSRQCNIPKNRFFMVKTEIKIPTTYYHFKYSTGLFYFIFLSAPLKRCLWIVSYSHKRRRKERLSFFTSPPHPPTPPYLFTKYQALAFCHLFILHFLDRSWWNFILILLCSFIQE